MLATITLEGGRRSLIPHRNPPLYECIYSARCIPIVWSAIVSRTTFANVTPITWEVLFPQTQWHVNASHPIWCSYVECSTRARTCHKAIPTGERRKTVDPQLELGEALASGSLREPKLTPTQRCQSIPMMRIAPTTRSNTLINGQEVTCPSASLKRIWFS